MLWAVNELANADKHRKDLVRVAARLQTQSVEVSHGIFIVDGSGPAIAFGGDPDFVCSDEERESLLVSYATGPHSIHPQINEAVSASVVFGPVKPIAGEEVLGTLGQQIRLVKGIVETFGKTF